MKALLKKNFLGFRLPKKGIFPEATLLLTMLLAGLVSYLGFLVVNEKDQDAAVRPDSKLPKLERDDLQS